MNHDESNPSFLSRWVRPKATSASSDWADYGTAFGLDLSMEDGVPHEAQPVVVASAQAAEAGWLARLRRRA